MLLRPIADQQALVIGATVAWIVWQLAVRTGWALLSEVARSIAQVLLLGPVLASQNPCRDTIKPSASSKGSPRPNTRHRPSHDPRAGLELPLIGYPPQRQLTAITPPNFACVSTSKPMTGNMWTPQAPSAVAGTCSNSKSGSSTGSSGGHVGQSSTTVAAQAEGNTNSASGSTVSSAAGQVTSSSRGGGWDDSDDGDGGKQPRQHKLATSHSLDMTAPMAEKIALAIAAARGASNDDSKAGQMIASSKDVSSRLADQAQHEPCTTASCPATASQQTAEADLSSTTATSVLPHSPPASITPTASASHISGTPRRWLQSPFAASESPFGSNSSSSSQQSKDELAPTAEAAAVQQPPLAVEAAAMQRVVGTGGSAVAGTTRPDSVDATGATTSSPPSPASAPAAKGTTGPWRLRSPFAAAGSPFGSWSGSSKSSGSSSSASGSSKSKSQSADKAAAAADGQPSTLPLAKPTTGPWKLLSPFAGGGSPFSSASGRSSRSPRSSTSEEPAPPAAADADADASAAAAGGPCSSTLGTTGPWKLSSPFAAADTPFASDSSRNSKDLRKGPKQKKKAADVQKAEETSKPATVDDTTVTESSTTAAQASAPAASAVTGPWKLASPFAAPLPAFSVAQDDQQDVPTAAGKASNSRARAPNERQSRSQKLHKDSTSAGAVHGGVAAAALPVKEPRHAKKSGVQSAASPPKPHSSTSSKGARHSTEQHGASKPKGVTGPWALHSPFAAAASPVSDQATCSSTAAADPFGSPIVNQFTDSDVRAEVTSKAAAAAHTAAQPASALIGGVAVQSTDASFDAWTANSRAPRSPAETAVAATPASSQGAPTPSAAPRTGPWQLYSPFAAAAAPSTAGADALDSKQGAAAPQAVQSERSDSAASNSSSSSVQRRACRKEAASAAAGGVSSSSSASGMGGTNSSSTDSLTGQSKPPTSIAAASEPQYSIPFSFPTTAGSGSHAATAPTLSSAATAALHDLLELDVQHTSSPAGSALLPEGGLSSVSSADADMVMSPVHEHDSQQQQQPPKSGVAGINAAASAVIASKAAGATVHPPQQQQFGSPPSFGRSSEEFQRQHQHLPSIAVARAKHLHDSVNSHLIMQQKQLSVPTVAVAVQQGSPAAGTAPVTAANPAALPGLVAQQGAVAWGVLPTTTAILPAVQAATLGRQAVPHGVAPAVTPAAAAATAAGAAPVFAVAQPGVGPAATASMYAAAPASSFAAPVMAPAGSPTPLVSAVPATAAVAATPAPAAAAAAAAAVPDVVTPNQAGSRSVQSSGTATPAASPRTAAAAAAASATAGGASAPSSPRVSLQLAVAGAAAAPRPVRLSCLCCYPPCLTEGMASEAHVYVLVGTDQQQGANQQQPNSTAASGTGVDMYRVVAMFGSVVVADVRNVWRPQEGLLRVPLPALPKGALRMAVALNDQPISFVQTLLVLPAPCAQEMVLLWASLLQTRLAAAAQLQQQRAATAATHPGASSSAQQQQGDASPTPRGSLDISGSSEGTGSAWTSQGSAASNMDSSSCALQGGQAGGTPAAAASRAAHSTAAVNYQAAVAGAQHGGQSSAAVSPADVQAVWHKQYMPVLTDIAYLLLPQPQKTAALGGGATSGQSSPTAAAAAAAGLASSSPRTSFAGGMSGAFAPAGHAPVQVDSLEFKSMVTQLVQFLAANGMWAVLQLITDSVYGVGASAKALYTAKAAAGPAGPSATVSNTSSDTPRGSNACDSGRDSLGSAGFGQVPSAPRATRQHSTPQTGSDSIATAPGGSTASSDRSGYSAGQQRPQQQQLAAGEAVAAATAAVQAGQVPELGGVFALFTLVLKLYLRRQFVNLGAGVRKVVTYLGRSNMLRAVSGFLGNILMCLAVGVVWLGELLAEKVVQPLFRSNSD